MILRILCLLTLLVASSIAAVASSVTVYAWPLSASSPKPFAEIQLPSGPDGAAVVRSKQLVAAKEGELIRVGLLDKDKAWSGVATSAASFKEGITQKITLYTDNDGQVKYLSFGAFETPSAAKGAKSDDVVVEIVPPNAGPEPMLNKPVVLNAEGKLDKPPEDSRTFIQKYWWALALFFVIQLAAGGGGKE